MLPNPHDDVELVPSDDTMIYRKPTDDSDEKAIADIWGTKLETRVVREGEVAAFVADGWATNPMQLGAGDKAPKADTPPANADDEKAAREAAENLAAELGETVKSLTKERDDALEAEKHAQAHIGELETNLSAEKALRASGAEHIRRLEEEAKALRAKAKP